MQGIKEHEIQIAPDVVLNYGAFLSEALWAIPTLTILAVISAILLFKSYQAKAKGIPGSRYLFYGFVVFLVFSIASAAAVAYYEDWFSANEGVVHVAGLISYVLLLLPCIGFSRMVNGYDSSRTSSST